jgi:hypothetical protein
MMKRSHDADAGRRDARTGEGTAGFKCMAGL